MWAANVMDIKQTLSKVCSKILEEEGVAKPEQQVEMLVYLQLLAAQADGAVSAR